MTEHWKTSDVRLHVGRWDHQAVAHKNFIYILGGFCRDGYTNAIEKFDVKTGRIEVLDEKLRVERSRFAVGKIDSDIYIFGGECQQVCDFTYEWTGLCEIFNLEKEEIKKGAKLPFRDFRDFTACVV